MEALIVVRNDSSLVHDEDTISRRFRLSFENRIVAFEEVLPALTMGNIRSGGYYGSDAALLVSNRHCTEIDVQHAAGFSCHLDISLPVPVFLRFLNDFLKDRRILE